MLRDALNRSPDYGTTVTSIQKLNPQHDEGGSRQHGKRRIHAVKKAPVSGQKIRGILDADKALEHRLPKVACNRKRNEERKRAHAPKKTGIVKEKVREDVLLHAEDIGQQEEDDHDHIGADRTLKGLLGRDGGGHAVLAPGPTAEVGRDVGSPDNEKNGKHEHPVALLEEPQKRQIGGGHEGHGGPEALALRNFEAVLTVEELGKEDHKPSKHDAAVHDQQEPVHAVKRPRPIKRQLNDHFHSGHKKGGTRPETADAQPLVERRAESDGHDAGKGERTDVDRERQDGQQHDCGDHAGHQHDE